MNKKIKVLFLSAEVAPLAKVGGLGDVAGSLPPALKDLGVDIRICMPLYGSINRKKYKLKRLKKVKTGSDVFEIWHTFLPKTNVPVYFIEHEFFQDNKIYWGKRKQIGSKITRGFADIMRFALFTRLALEAMKTINFRPDIIHANDWHAALAGNYCKDKKNGISFLKNTKILYTIHNLANQGISAPEIIRFCKIDPVSKNVKNDLKNNDLNFMAQGILNSDKITTVSPQYAKEILTKEYGAGLDKVLRSRKNDLRGILNGIDTVFFDPENDKFIFKKFNRHLLKNKKLNKFELQRILDWKKNDETLLIGIVSRLVRQKGFDLVTENLIKSLDAQFVILGTGQEEIENDLLKLSKKYPNKIKIQIKFDEKIAHQIYAGSDIFLMPSRFEPCGLGQMIAMRYGTVPVVRLTGGLADTVKQFNKANNSGTGFLFKDTNVRSLTAALRDAARICYHLPEKWKQLQLNCMNEDFSWANSAKEYNKIYNDLLNRNA